MRSNNVNAAAWVRKHPHETSTLLTPPALTDEEKRSRIHYLRVAKTGSSAALHYFGLTNCSRRVQVHTSHMDMQVAFPQRSLAVLREPCDRAGSLLSHLLGTYVSPNGTASRYIKYYNHSLRLSNKTSLLELAAFVATTGISRSRVLGRHNTVFFAQSRYIGPRTEAALARVHRVGRVPVVASGRQQSTGQCALNSTFPHFPHFFRHPLTHCVVDVEVCKRAQGRGALTGGEGERGGRGRKRCRRGRGR